MAFGQIHTAGDTHQEADLAARGGSCGPTGASRQRIDRSVPAEAARRDDCLKFGEIQVADRLQCFGERAVSQVLRQAIQPGRILNLTFHEAGNVVVPPPGPAAMIERAAHTNDRFAGRSRGPIDLMSVFGSEPS